jgi:hypothetical protein
LLFAQLTLGHTRLIASFDVSFGLSSGHIKLLRAVGQAVGLRQVAESWAIAVFRLRLLSVYANLQAKVASLVGQACQ